MTLHINPCRVGGADAFHPAPPLKKGRNMTTTTLEPIIITEPYIETRPDHLLPRPKKPSEILRAMPPERWIRAAYADREGRYCAVTWLALQAGYAGELDFNVCGFVDNAYGFARSETNSILGRNDTLGLDAAIQYLESIGK